MNTVVTGNDELSAKRDELKAGLAGKFSEKDLTKAGVTLEDVEAVKTYKLVADSGEEAAGKLDAALSAEAKAGLTSYTDALAKHGAIQQDSGRDVLIYAARFPAILVISFAFIALYFRSKGGYKPVILDPEADPEEKEAAVAHEEHPAPGEDADEHTPM